MAFGGRGNRFVASWWGTSSNFNVCTVNGIARVLVLVVGGGVDNLECARHNSMTAVGIHCSGQSMFHFK